MTMTDMHDGHVDIAKLGDTPRIKIYSALVLLTLTALAFTAFDFVPSVPFIGHVVGPKHRASSRPTEHFRMFWIGSDPSQDKSDFLYYRDIGKALSQLTPVLKVCKTIDNCFRRCDEKRHSLVMALPHKLTIQLSSLTDREPKMLEAIRRIKANMTSSDNSCKFRRIILVMFVNKVYRADLHERLTWFKNISDGSARLLQGTCILRSLAFTWSPRADEWSKQYNIPIKFIPFGVNHTKFDVRERYVKLRNCDVFLHWDTSPKKYRLRKELTERLTSDDFAHQTNLTVLAPDWQDEESYLDSLASCKYHFSTIGMPGRFDLLGTRYYEVLSSGKAVLFALAETPRDVAVYESSGLVDGLNCITFSDVDDAVQKLLLYKELHNKTAELASSASEWATHQSWSKRALDILDALRELD